MLDQERLEEEDRSDAPYRHHPHKQDRVTHRRLLLHDYGALANDVRIRGTYERRRRARRFPERQRGERRETGNAAAEDDREGQAGGIGQRRSDKRPRHSSHHVDRPGASVNVLVFLAPPHRIQAVVDKRGLRAVEQGEGDAPDKIRQQQQGERRCEAEKRDRDGEGRGRGDESGPATPAVRQRRGRDLEQYDAQPKRNVDQCYLRLGEPAFLLQVDDSNRPPELEVQEEIEEVISPNVRLHWLLSRLAARPQVERERRLAQFFCEGLGVAYQTVATPGCQLRYVTTGVRCRARRRRFPARARRRGL